MPPRCKPPRCMLQVRHYRPRRTAWAPSVSSPPPITTVACVRVVRTALAEAWCGPRSDRATVRFNTSHHHGHIWIIKHAQPEQTREGAAKLCMTHLNAWALKEAHHMGAQCALRTMTLKGSRIECNTARNMCQEIKHKGCRALQLAKAHTEHSVPQFCTPQLAFFTTTDCHIPPGLQIHDTHAIPLLESSKRLPGLPKLKMLPSWAIAPKSHMLGPQMAPQDGLAGGGPEEGAAPQRGKAYAEHSLGVNGRRRELIQGPRRRPRRRDRSADSAGSSSPRAGPGSAPAGRCSACLPRRARTG